MEMSKSSPEPSTPGSPPSICSPAPSPCGPLTTLPDSQTSVEPVISSSQYGPLVSSGRVAYIAIGIFTKAGRRDFSFAIPSRLVEVWEKKLLAFCQDTLSRDLTLIDSGSESRKIIDGLLSAILTADSSSKDGSGTPSSTTGSTEAP